MESYKNMPSDGILFPATAATQATASRLPIEGRSGTPHAAAALQGFCSSSRTVCTSVGSLLIPWINLALIARSRGSASASFQMRASCGSQRDWRPLLPSRQR
uniref:Uncharacterized protein n=1 Tax=Arundo donax TaxID=35708 RepID=A0A0A9DK38_ARUDO